MASIRGPRPLWALPLGARVRQAADQVMRDAPRRRPGLHHPMRDDAHRPHHVMGQGNPQDPRVDFLPAAHEQGAKGSMRPCVGIDPFGGRRPRLVDGFGLIGRHARAPRDHRWRIAPTGRGAIAGAFRLRDGRVDGHALGRRVRDRLPRHKPAVDEFIGWRSTGPLDDLIEHRAQLGLVAADIADRDAHDGAPVDIGCTLR